ncbi:MAG: hypothetical protein Q8R37_04015 [Nanoarchaeota archaeon]|nr:hypothetical protein [Nanoarchaeota archaeon]
MNPQLLLYQLYTLDQEQKKIRRAKHHFFSEKTASCKNIEDVIKNYSFTEDQIPLVHDYLHKADTLDALYNHKAEDVLEPYVGRIVGAVVSFSGLAGAAVGYAYALTKAHFGGEIEYDEIAISVIAGIIIGYRPFGLVLSHNLSVIKKVKAEYRQEMKTLIEDTVSELMK